MPNQIIYSGYDDTGYRPASGAGSFGSLGDLSAVTFHHSAGPRATSKAKAIELHKAYQKQHIAKGYGDIAYHFSLDDHGRYYRLRSLEFKGAHVGGWNTGNVGIMVHGNYMDDQINEDQYTALRWLFVGGFYTMLGARESDIALVRGHREWPDHGSNLCPGTDLMSVVRDLRNKEFH